MIELPKNRVLLNVVILLTSLITECQKHYFKKLNRNA